MISVLTCTSGRHDLYTRTLTRFVEMCGKDFQFFTVNDSGQSSDPYMRVLEDISPTYGYAVLTSGVRLGFCGAIQQGWRYLQYSDFVVHLEDDFLIETPINFNLLSKVFDGEPRLAQIALTRNSVNAHEAAHGGVIGCDPNAYQEEVITVTSDDTGSAVEIPLIFHKKFFTTNVCIYPKKLIEDWDWPDAPGCEGEFSRQLFENDYWCAFLGKKTDSPYTTHIGDTRNGFNY